MKKGRKNSGFFLPGYVRQYRESRNSEDSRAKDSRLAFGARLLGIVRHLLCGWQVAQVGQHVADLGC